MITQERLKEVLHYDSETGVFTWRKRISIRIVVGSVSNCINSEGYIVIRIDKKLYLSHRLAWLYVYGYLPENLIDHKDRDKTNNSISNLRESTKSCNAINSKVRADNTTGVTGVYLSKNKKRFSPEIYINGKKIWLGTYDTFIEAVNARWEAEVKYDFPNCRTTSSAFQYIESQKKP